MNTPIVKKTYAAPSPGFQREGSTFHHVVCYVTHQTARGSRAACPRQTKEKKKG